MLYKIFVLEYRIMIKNNYNVECFYRIVRFLKVKLCKYLFFIMYKDVLNWNLRDRLFLIRLIVIL